MTRILVIGSGRRMKLGFSVELNLMMPRMKRAGFEIAHLEIGRSRGEPYQDEDGILVLPTMDDFYGNDVYGLHMTWTQADYSLSMVNAWCLDPAAIGGRNHAVWEMVEVDPLRPKDVRALRGGARWILAPSRSGMHMLEEACFAPIYCPLGVDTNVYHPIDRAGARARMQSRADGHQQDRGFDWRLGDKFLAVMVGMNNIEPARKGFFEGLTAFKIFHDRHPDSVLYLHTRMAPRKGVNIKHTIEAVGLKDGVLDYPNQYYYACGMIPDAWMNDAYNAADVLLHPSHMEGFGLPIVEAQAAGTPVIVTDYSAMPELVFSGRAVPGQKYEAQNGWYWKRPSIDALVDALEEAYQKRDDQKQRETARAGALAYDADKVYAEYMDPALTRIAEEAEDPEKYLASAWGHKHEIDANGVKLSVRTLQDRNVAHDVQREYFPDIIDYTHITRAVDVGAHIGSWSLFVKSKSPDARIVCIEAMPENAALLRENVNHGTEGITVLEGMCAYTPGEYDMLIDPAATGGSTLVKREVDVPRAGEYAIRRAYEGGRYDLRFVFEHCTPFKIRDYDLLKLDCEGGEYDILNNAPAEDLTAFHWIVGEYHNELGDIKAALKRLEPWFTVRALNATNAHFGLFCLERKADVT